MASFSPGGSPGTMQVSPPPTARLDVLGAFRDGWSAFRRAPWVFVGFTLLVAVLGTCLALIYKNLIEAGLTPLTWWCWCRCSSPWQPVSS